MTHLSYLLVSALAAACVYNCFFTSAAATPHHIVYTASNTIPPPYQLHSLTPQTTTLSFYIALTQRNLHQLDELFFNVSTPQHQQWRQFQTTQQLMDLIQPAADEVQPVIDWLLQHDIELDSITVLGDTILVNTSIQQIQSLFNTHIAAYRLHHQPDSKLLYRVSPSSSLHIPLHLASIIEMVIGLTSFPADTRFSVKRARSFRGDRHHKPIAAIIPQSIYQIYNIPVQQPDSGLTSHGVIEFERQNFNPVDVANYSQLTSVAISEVRANHVVGINDPYNAQVEATLDIELLSSTNIASSNWFWLCDNEQWLFEFATHFFQRHKIPAVISLSYGWSELFQCDVDIDECQRLGVDSKLYVKRVDTLFQLIGLRGVSIFIASGDSGANGRTDSSCSIPQLRPAYPASSPYVTTVGATQIINPTYNVNSAPPVCSDQRFQCVSDGYEVAVSFSDAGFSSGGGFSNISTSRPHYQAEAVQHYLNNPSVELPPESYFNRLGRALPDISAIGSNTLISMQNRVEAVGGTSASAPIAAALFALLNEVEVRRIGKTLGFLNPLLYQAAADDPTTFTDIVKGDNKCTESGCSDQCKGFEAAQGWDPVTGLGTPVYSRLKEYLEENSLAIQ